MVGSREHDVQRWAIDRFDSLKDHVGVEAPLEIRLQLYTELGLVTHPLVVTMRTPGEDIRLALGFLYAEGIIGAYGDVEEAQHGMDERGRMLPHLVKIRLKPGLRVDLEHVTRRAMSIGGCGLCGKSDLESIFADGIDELSSDFKVKPQILMEMPHSMRQAQQTFRLTGALHAAALFDRRGTMLSVFEDVGRHNAVDKIIGLRVEKDGCPASQSVLVLSGRIGFELIQKALIAGIPVIAGIGAPTSLAIDLALEYGATLIGFLKDDGFCVYAGAHRLRIDGGKNE